MPIYKGSVKQKDIYIGSTKIGKVYKGSTLVYQSKLPAGQVIFESSTAGTYTIVIPKTQAYHIDLVGGGGGGHHKSAPQKNKGGGSGGYVYGTIMIPKGNYTLVIGNGGGDDQNGYDSSFFEQIAGGGKASSGGYAGGTCSTSLSYVNGNYGGSGVRGESVYNGYGRGGYDYEAGTAGYCKIVAV